jgi:uncharacterized membrane protein
MKLLQQTLTVQWKQQRLYFALAVFCVALLLLRGYATKSMFFFFLVWNLFLAYTPLSLTMVLMGSPAITAKKSLLFPALFAWLLLLPNAPYIITDFIHIKKETGVPVWFDVLLIVSFAATGLLFGLASMKNVYTLLRLQFTKATATYGMAIISILCAFGIYVGRYLRYNSWDILHHPITLTGDILHSLTAADTVKPAWGITLGFGTLLYLLFSLYHSPEN